MLLKKRRFFFPLFSFLLIFFSVSHPIFLFAQPEDATIVVDYNSNKILYAQSATEYRYPASLTKVMTLYLVFKAVKNGKLTLYQKLPVSRHAATREPSKLGLRPGQTITVHDAIYAVITKSANDAATVLAEGVSGNEREFSRLMTRQARALGMYKTFFYNASGLPHPLQRTTARDLAILASALLRDFPNEYRYFKTTHFKYRGSIYRNHNRLLERYPGVDGIKTGYIRASGFNIIVSAKYRGHRIIAVVLGRKTSAIRDAQAMKLLDQLL